MSDVQDLESLFELTREAVEGEWIDFGDPESACPGFKVRYVDVSAIEFLKLRNKYAKPFRKLMDAGMLTEAQDRMIAIRCFTEAGLLDWRNVKMAGEVLAFSRETAERVFSRFPKLYTFVANAMVDEQRFKPSEGILGNLGRPLASD